MQDSTAVLIALIGAAANIIVSLRTHRRIEEVEHNTNSKLDELVKIKGESEHAKGMLQGAAEEVARSKEEDRLS